MYAISGLSTVQEPLVDKTRITEDRDYGTRRNSRLPEDLEETFPLPNWTLAKYNNQKQRLPQTIAHRGYKAVYPENTMRAFEGAIEVGANAIETDIHLSKDGVVVLSHDKDLKRCFGREERIIDCDWTFLSQQKTLAEPHEPMPRLTDLLEYLAKPEQERIWTLLDIKVDNDAEDVMRLIADTIKAVDSGPRRWNQRIVLGIWAARYLPLCAQYLPGFPVSHIGFSTSYARQFLKVPNISFNMLQRALFGPIGSRFIRDVKIANRPLFVWTVNEVNFMKWSVQRKVDGVITDNPKLFREVCDNWDDREPIAQPNWLQLLNTLWLYIMMLVYWIPFKRRFPETVEAFLKTRNAKSMAAPKVK